MLRKAYVIARKLSLREAQTWIDMELNGYKAGDQAPPYRVLTGEIKAWNPYLGVWIPCMMPTAEMSQSLSKCFVGQPIGQLEDLAKQDGGTLLFPFHPEIQSRLMKGQEVPLQPTRLVSKTGIVGILHAVRHLVLDWCLDLERDGILGEGLTFNTEEKKTASHTNYSITYNAPVGTSQVQQGSQDSSQAIANAPTDLSALKEVLAELNEQLHKLQLNSADETQLKADILTIQSQASSPRPSRVIIQEGINSLVTILEAAAGNLLAAGLLHKITHVPF